MNAKLAFLIGLMGGLVIAAVAVFVTLVATGGAIKEREAAAYEKGQAEGAVNSRLVGENISTAFNQLMVEENERRSKQAAETRAALNKLLARTDLPAEARTQAQQALDLLGAD